MTQAQRQAGTQWLAVVGQGGRGRIVSALEDFGEFAIVIAVFAEKLFGLDDGAVRLAGVVVAEGDVHLKGAGGGIAGRHVQHILLQGVAVAEAGGEVFAEGF